MTTDSPPQDTGRGARRRRAVERGGGAVAAPAGQPLSPFAPLDLVSRDELESIHQAALDGPEGDRHRLPARRGARDAEERRRRRRSGLEAGALRSRAGRGAYRACAEGIHPARAQSGAQSHDRRASRRLRLGGERAQFVRPRRRTQARQQSRLPELHPPRAELRFDPFLGRLSGRADRHSRLRPSSRRAVRHADAVRQADPRLQPRARAQSRRDRDGQDRARASTTRRSSASRRCSRSSIRPRR